MSLLRLLLPLFVISVGACVELDVSVFNRTSNKSIHQPPVIRSPISLVSLAEYKHSQAQKEQALGEIVLPCMAAGMSRPANAHKQEADNWCWAATAQVVLEPHNVTDWQCQLVNKALGKDNCCGSNLRRADGSLETPCDVRGWPDKILNAYGFTPKGVSGFLDWEALTKEICLTGPFIPVVKWGRSKGEGLHTIVVNGYKLVPLNNAAPDSAGATQEILSEGAGTARVIRVFDPSFDTFYDVPYKAYVGDNPNDADGPYGHRHEFAYVGITPG